ncbi:MAG: 6-carboxytetrahydropterin synthase [Flavobacteriales bacterium]|nr:6-carboxytetrahydropterin synthase [Flavobacteriales bacterium]
MIYITRKESFNSAHRVYNPEWSDEKNEQIFGRCSNPNWHGHNFKLLCTVKGIPSKETGFVINLKTLGIIMTDNVIDIVDHRNLNLDVPFMKGIIPSTENFAKKIWDQLLEPIAKEGVTLHSIKLIETEKHYVEYFGE